jgi:uncharacterized membrane protein
LGPIIPNTRAVCVLSLLILALFALPAAATGNFTISASPSSLTIGQNGFGISTITTTISGGFNSGIALSASGMPPGVAASFRPPIIGPPGAGTSTMTIQVIRITVPGTYTFSVSGTGGGIKQSTMVTLTVAAQTQPNFAMVPIPASLSIAQGGQGFSTIYTTTGGGFNGSISLSASGMPSGTTVGFSPQTIPAPGAGSSVMTINVGESTPVGAYPLTVTGDGGGIRQTTVVTLTVISSGGPDFTISVSPSSLSISQGGRGSTTVTTTISGGFNNGISLSATGAPIGVTVNFNPQTIPAPGNGSSTMTLIVYQLAPVGTYPITITGSGGGTKHSTTFTLTVLAAPDFELAASPSSLTILQGKQGQSTITSVIYNGFNSAVSLSSSGAPVGVVVSFNPQTIPAPGSGTSSMTISVSTNTAPGVYSILVSGSGGGLLRNIPFALTVSAAPTFAIGASPSSLAIPQGNQGTSTVTTFPFYGFNNSINLSASGAPSGTTLNLNPATISAPGAGHSMLTVTVGKSTATGTYPITVTGNGGGTQQNTTVTLTVTGGAPPAQAKYMEPYSYTLQSSFGTPPYTYQITSGSLPSGLSMNASGTISGSATAVGKFNFRVLATDSSQPPQKQSSSYTVNVVIGMDKYGGLTAAPVPGCTPTGYFQLVKVKIGNKPARWVYADPNCYAFYSLSVFAATPGDILQQIMQSHYGNDLSKWSTHALNRELAYGFNANDIFYADYMLPIPKGGNQSGATPQVPFILYFAADQDAVFNPGALGLPEALKNIIAGQDQYGYHVQWNLYNIDLMDPNWLLANQGELQLQLNPAEGGFLDGFNNTPWIVAVSLGDGDEVVLFKGVGPGGYAQPAQVVATSAFNFNKPPVNGNWQRPILYSKAAWTCNAIANDPQHFPSGQSFLEKKYNNNIAALNASWGSNYTSFCDAGGFGGGSGVLDEDGRHTAWFGNDYYNQTGMNPNLLADLNAYMYIMALQIYPPQINTLKTYDPNHLMLCGFYGGDQDGGVRPLVAQALGASGCQVLNLTWGSSSIQQSIENNKQVYDLSGVPSTIYQGSTAQADSDMSNYPNNGADGANYPTQEERGQHYGIDTQAIYGEQGTNGDYYNLGVSLWSLTDLSGENRNWGFISLSDNVYDGVCATTVPSIDQWGYACGGEAANYGDFTDDVTQANTALYQQLIPQLQH